MPAGIARPVAVEVQLAIAPAEDGSVDETTIRVRRVFVTRAVDVELFPFHFPFGVGEKQRADSEGSEAELGLREGLAGTADGLTAMQEAELGRDDEDVTLLLFGKLGEHLLRLLGLTEIPLVELVFTPVLELAALADEAEHLLGGFTVGLADRLPTWDSEPAFGSFGKSFQFQVLGVGVGRRAVEAVKLRERFDLLGERLRTVGRGVVVVGRDLLVRVLVGDGELVDELFQPRLEFTATFVQPLGTSAVELGLVVDRLAESDEMKAFGVLRRDQHGLRRHHRFLCIRTVGRAALPQGLRRAL